MDPWLSVDDQVAGEDQLSCHQGHETKAGGVVSLVNSSDDNPPLDPVDKPPLSFDDHFQPPFVKLPDSSEYLASLEKKLKSVQSGGKNLSSGKILRSLEETRESYMVQLLRDPQSIEAETQFDELSVNPILKKLAPEKQAISIEELIQLVKADQLSLLLDSENPPGPTEEELTTSPGSTLSSSTKNE